MKGLVVGGGSIGSRHLRNLVSLGITDLALVEPDGQRRENLSQEIMLVGFQSLEKGLSWGPDFVVIATPTNLHIVQALDVARAGCHLFIEKPLSHMDEGINELVEIVQCNQLITMVGCNMRFHHGPAAVKRLLDECVIGRVISVSLDAGQYMPDWHPELDYRQRYSANRSMGGGVVLDGIHEIDYARWLFGEVIEVFSYGGKLSNLEIDVEDTVNILLKFESGFSAMLHIDYIQRIYSRTCKVIGDEGTIVWDISKQPQVRWFSAKTKQWNSIELPEHYHINDMYKDELSYFLDCVRENKNTMSDVVDAARVTRLALAIKQSMELGEKIAVKPNP